MRVLLRQYVHMHSLWDTAITSTRQALGSAADRDPKANERCNDASGLVVKWPCYTLEQGVVRYPKEYSPDVPVRTSVQIAMQTSTLERPAP